MDLGLMCLCGHNRILQKMMRKAMMVFVVGAFLQYRARGRGTSCSRSRPSPALGSRAER